MGRDPGRVAMFPLLAETLGILITGDNCVIGEVMNEVVEPLSIKAMLFIGILVLAGAYVLVVGLPRSGRRDEGRRRDDGRDEGMRRFDNKYWDRSRDDRRMIYR